MITLDDLNQAIAECQGERDPNAETCKRLAAFITIRNELYPPDRGAPVPPYSTQYSAMPAPVPAQTVPAPSTVEFSGGSEFAHAVNGRNAREIWLLVDDLVSTIGALYPRLYDGFMRELHK